MKIYRSVIYVSIMMLIAGVLLFMLHQQRSSITNDVNDNATEDMRVADLLRIVRVAHDEPELATYLNSTFQSADDEVIIIEKLEKIADRVGVIIEITEAEVIKTDDGKEKLNITVNAKGGWHSVYNFISLIDHFPFPHTTHRMQFVKDKKESNWDVIIGMSVELASQ